MEIENQNTTEVSTEALEVSDAVETKASPMDELKSKAKELSDDDKTTEPLVDPKELKESKKAKKATTEKEVVVPAPTIEDIPAYSPDFKYKANGQVKEIDERLRAVIKDKDTEEWLKKTLSKADGLEEVQAHRDHIRNEFNTLASQAKEIISDVDSGNYGVALQKLGVDTKNVGKVMAGLGIQKEEIIKYAYSLTQLTPEQEMAQNKQRELELNSQRQQSTVQELNQKLYEQDVQIKTTELRTVLSTPDFAPLVAAYDQTKGQGAFWDEVCQRGEYSYLLAQQGRGREKSPMELVNEVAAIAKHLVPQAPVQTMNQAIPAQNQFQKQTTVPVIPNVGGGNSSPAKQKIKSVDQLKAYAKTLSD